MARHARRTASITAWCCMGLLLAVGVRPLPAAGAAELSPAADALTQGIRSYQRGEYADAIGQLATARELEPDHSPAALYLGLAQARGGKPGEAAKTLREYLTLDPATDGEVLARKKLEDYVKLLDREENHRLARSALASEPGPGDPRTVAVTYYKNAGSAVLSPMEKGFAGLLIDDLSKVKVIQVVSRDRMQALVEEMSLGIAGEVSKSTAPRVGRLLGAGKVTTGEISDLDSLQVGKSGIHVVFSLSESATGQTPVDGAADGSLDQFHQIEKTVALQLLSGLGYSEERLRQLGVWEAVTKPATTNLSAFEAYSAGLDAADDGDFDLARQHLDRALAEDSGFTLAKTTRDALPTVATVALTELTSTIDGAAPPVAAATEGLPEEGLSLGEKVLIGAGVVAVAAGAGYLIYDSTQDNNKVTRTPVCGDGKKEGAEQCDDGFRNDELDTKDDCPSGPGLLCKLATCGDLFVHKTSNTSLGLDPVPGAPTVLEECETNDDCAALHSGEENPRLTCVDCNCRYDPNNPETPPFKQCGDGVKQAGEECEGGAGDQPPEPNPDCPGQTLCDDCLCIGGCGDGDLDSGEECDPGAAGSCGDPSLACALDCQKCCGWSIRGATCTIAGLPTPDPDDPEGPGQNGNQRIIKFDIKNDCGAGLPLTGVVVQAISSDNAGECVATTAPFDVPPGATVTQTLSLICDSNAFIDIVATALNRGAIREIIGGNSDNGCVQQGIGCGDGIVQSDTNPDPDVVTKEDCDDGNSNNSDSCVFCQNARCGDAYQFAGVEQCDCGDSLDDLQIQDPRCMGRINSDLPNVAKCRRDCTLPGCGDGITDDAFGEQCDNGPGNANLPNATCRLDCLTQRCGDGIVDDAFGEGCDLGRRNGPGSPCSDDCQVQ